MREHLFRGKYTDGNGNQHWIAGHYTEGSYINPDTGEQIKRYIISNEDGLFDVDPATVGEFIGFFYGFKVFEDDIIHLKGKEYDKDFGVVRWHENGYFYIDDSFGEFPKDRAKPAGDFFDSISTDFKGTSISVSGNIHENPELGEIHKRKY